MCTALLFAFSSWAQQVPEYLEHRFYGQSSGGAFHFRNNAQKTPYGFVNNGFYASLTTPASINLALGAEDEWHYFGNEFPGNTHNHTVFRSLNSETLQEQSKWHVYRQRLPDETNMNVVGITFAGASFNESTALIDLQMGQHSQALINNTLFLTHSSNLWSKNVLMLVSSDTEVLFKREILYKHDTQFRRAIGFSWDARMHEKLHDGLFATDFAFSDTIVMVIEGDTAQHYSEQLTTWIELRDDSGVLHSGTLQGSGSLSRLRTIITGNRVLRVFRISGSFPLSPLPTAALYETPPDEWHLLLVSYELDGTIAWTKKLATYNNYPPNSPGSFTLDIVHTDSKAVLYSGYTSSGSFGGLPSGMFTQYVGETPYESGLLQATATFTAHSPIYLHVIDLESGTTEAAYRYASHSLENQYSSYLQGLPLLYILHGYDVLLLHRMYASTGNESRLKRIYPTEEELFNFPPPATQQTHRGVRINSQSFACDMMFGLGSTSGSGGGLTFTALPRAADEVILCGSVALETTVHFSGGELLTVSSGASHVNDHRGLALYIKVPSDLSFTTGGEANTPQVYPNPAHDVLYWDADSPPSVYKVYYLTGKEILSSITAGNSIGLNGLSPGMYVLELQWSSGSIRRARFVKQ
jgi:hypothetical protein